MPNINFKYRCTILDCVDTFNYLGITFCYTGNFTTACKVLAEQSMKCTFVVFLVCFLYNLFFFCSNEH